MKSRIVRAGHSFQRRLLAKAQQPGKYKVDEKILLRYPFKTSRVPTRRLIINGIILNVNASGNRYHAVYRNPKSKVKKNYHMTSRLGVK